MNKIWVGVDTSNYTTSLASISDSGEVLNIKIPLSVKPGERGVRQSDAVFMHTKNLPNAFDRLYASLGEMYGGLYKIEAVGVSTRPRPLDGSYMPCFLLGISSAHAMAFSSRAPLYEFSHQEGHIRAALHGANILPPQHFYSFHLSGGTCELLEVFKTEYGFDERIVAESADITLGQLVDRTGVMLGMNFPCGPDLERAALLSDKHYKIKIHGTEKINLAGFENIVNKMSDDKLPVCDIAAYVYDVIYTAVIKMLSVREDTDLPVVFAGGVSGSSIFKNQIKSECNALFAPPELSSDNAVGIAILARERFLKAENE